MVDRSDQSPYGKFTLRPQDIDFLSGGSSRTKDSFFHNVPDEFKDIDKVWKLGDRYLVKKDDGKKGGYGQVLEAYDMVGHRVVMVKVVRESTTGFTDQQREKFLQEVIRMAQIESGIPYVVPPIDFIKESPYGPALIMKKSEGVTLRSAVEKERQEHKIGLPLEQVSQVIREMGSLVDYMWNAIGKDGQPIHMLHYDLTPDNIFLTKGHIRVIDFGLAIQRDELKDRSLTQFGTVEHIAPERVDPREEITFKTEIYSIASNAYFLLTGENLTEEDEFYDASADVLNLKRKEKLSQKLPSILRNRGLSPAKIILVVDILTKALDKDQNQRHESAQEFSEALTQALTPDSNQRTETESEKITRQRIVESFHTLEDLSQTLRQNGVKIEKENPAYLHPDQRKEIVDQYCIRPENVKRALEKQSTLTHPILSERKPLEKQVVLKFDQPILLKELPHKVPDDGTRLYEVHSASTVDSQSSTPLCMLKTQESVFNAVVEQSILGSNDAIPANLNWNMFPKAVLYPPVMSEEENAELWDYMLKVGDQELKLGFAVTVMEYLPETLDNKMPKVSDQLTAESVDQALQHALSLIEFELANKDIGIEAQGRQLDDYRVDQSGHITCLNWDSLNHSFRSVSQLENHILELFGLSGKENLLRLEDKLTSVPGVDMALIDAVFGYLFSTRIDTPLVDPKATIKELDYAKIRKWMRLGG